MSPLRRIRHAASAMEYTFARVRKVGRRQFQPSRLLKPLSMSRLSCSATSCPHSHPSLSRRLSCWGGVRPCGNAGRRSQRGSLQGRSRGCSPSPGASPARAPRSIRRSGVSASTDAATARGSDGRRPSAGRASIAVFPDRRPAERAPCAEPGEEPPEPARDRRRAFRRGLRDGLPGGRRVGARARVRDHASVPASAVADEPFCRRRSGFYRLSNTQYRYSFSVSRQSSG